MFVFLTKESPKRIYKVARIEKYGAFVSLIEYKCLGKRFSKRERERNEERLMSKGRKK